MLGEQFPWEMATFSTLLLLSMVTSGVRDNFFPKFS